MRVLAIALIVMLVVVPAESLEKEGELLTKFRIDLLSYAGELLGLVPDATTCEDIMAIYLLEKQTDVIGAYFWGFATTAEFGAALKLFDKDGVSSPLVHEQREFMSLKFQDIIDDLGSYEELTDLTEVIRIAHAIRRDVIEIHRELGLPEWNGPQ